MGDLKQCCSAWKVLMCESTFNLWRVHNFAQDNNLQWCLNLSGSIRFLFKFCFFLEGILLFGDVCHKIYLTQNYNSYTVIDLDFKVIQDLWEICVFQIVANPKSFFLLFFFNLWMSLIKLSLWFILSYGLFVKIINETLSAI